MEKFRGLFIYCLLGSTALCGLSLFQKLLIGYDITLHGFYVPFLAGGCFGLIVGMWNLSLVKANKKMVEEIENRKTVEEKLKDSERRLNAIFDHHYQLTGLIDTKGRLIDANRTALGFAQAEKSKVIGCYFWDTPWWDPSQKPELYDAVERALRGEFVRFSTTHLTADKEIRYIDFSLSPVQDENGNVIYIVPEGRDITEIKHAEKERALLHEQLAQSQKMEAIGTLAGGIAHDFNNILSGIFGYSQLAIAEMDDKEKAKQRIEQVIKSAHKATDLVQQILTVSRKSSHEIQPLAIFLVVKEALKLIKASIPSTIQIKESILSKATVMADPTKVHQVVMNLCTNAYHAMAGTGGILAVVLQEVEFSEKDAMPGPGIKPGRFLKLEVSDTGDGMEPDVRNKIFEPYFTTKEPGKGTGLGLAVVFGIVQEYKGHINVCSEPGQGTTFHVYLPIVEKSVEPLTQKKENKPMDGSERILLIDDEKDLLSAINELLENSGYRVTSFSSALKALEAFEEHPDDFDVVITDMTMPGMTGLDLSKKLLELRPGQPIILCTGHSEQINRQKAMDLGISEYYEKPVIISKLTKAIRKVLDNI